MVNMERPFRLITRIVEASVLITGEIRRNFPDRAGNYLSDLIENKMVFCDKFMSKNLRTTFVTLRILGVRSHDHGLKLEWLPTNRFCLKW